MTGYGQSQISRDGVTLSLDVQCLNSRFFDMVTRMPRIIQKWEPEMRQQTQGVLTRGKVSITVTLSIDEEVEVPIRINLARLRQYQQLFLQMKEELHLSDGPSLSHFTSMADVIEVGEINRDDLYSELLLTSLGEALGNVMEMREAEGKHLAADMTMRSASIKQEMQTIERLARDRRSSDLERYRARIQELMENVPVDEGRLLQEAAILAEKRDITEEYTRFQSHLDLFQAYIDDEEDTGKRLGFLLQEMGREVNTLGAKTDHVDINHAVVRIKDELEKIREQVQNIL